MKNSRAYNKAYYERMKEQRLPQVLARQKAIRDQIKAYKLDRGCSSCGYHKSSRALQFHHNNGDKEHNISKMMAQGRALKSIFAEINKCIIVCANCHAELHEQIYGSVA